MSKHLLHDNIDQFFERVESNHSDKMKCSEGCSKCCYTDISIFTFEADLIQQWFKNLTDSKKKTLKDKWDQTCGPNEDLEGVKRDPCVFLVEDRCSIYEIRPSICRSQGLPLLIDNEVSHCPLNFEELPERESWLDLNRLNTLISLAQSHHSNENERISLKKLKEELIRSINEKV